MRYTHNAFLPTREGVSLHGSRLSNRCDTVTVSTLCTQLSIHLHVKWTVVINVVKLVYIYTLLIYKPCVALSYLKYSVYRYRDYRSSIRLVCISSTILFLPRAHAQGVKQSVLSVYCHKKHQILSSRHLCMLYMYIQRIGRYRRKICASNCRNRLHVLALQIMYFCSTCLWFTDHPLYWRVVMRLHML